MADDASGWDGYVARFHDEEPGITEDLLDRTASEGLDPYAWCAEALAARPGTILDLACGSGPMAGQLRPTGAPGGGTGSGWVGIDTSAAELAVAQRHGRGAVLRGSATELPVPDGAVGTVVCSMSLQVIEPLEPAWEELDRVLGADGRVVLLLPASWPLTARDAWTYLRLQIALRAVIGYPNGSDLARRKLARRVGRHGLVVRSDEARRFALPLTDRATATLLVRSLYLPDVPDERRRRAERVLEGRVGSPLGIPLRRVVLDRR